VIGAGVYEAAYDVATHERVQAILDDPARRTSMANGRAAYLLSGVARCGACQEAAVNVLPSASGGRRYGCPRCFGVGRSVEFVDSLVVAVLMRMLAAPDAAAALGRPDDDAARAAVDAVTTLRDRLDRAADQYADGVIDAQQLARITSRLRPELERAERTVRDRALAPTWRSWPARAWSSGGSCSVSTGQRAVVRYLLEVTILPTDRKERLAVDFVRVTPRVA
jgi:site-specific DNA recombinase